MFDLALVNDLRILTPDKTKDYGRSDPINLELAAVPGSESMVMQLSSGLTSEVTPFEAAALRALRDSFPDGAKLHRSWADCGEKCEAHRATAWPRDWRHATW